MTVEKLAALEYRARTFGGIGEKDALDLIAEVRGLNLCRDDDEREAWDRERKIAESKGSES